MISVRPIAIALLVAVGATAALPALASDYRQARQSERIEQGVRSGALTPRETAKLVEEQRRIEALKRDAKHDGYVSPAERRRIEAARNLASRHIYAEKHDRERVRRYGRHWDGRRWAWGWYFGPRWY